MSVFYMHLPPRSFCPFGNSVIPPGISSFFPYSVMIFSWCLETLAVCLIPPSFQDVICTRNSIIHLYEQFLSRKAFSNTDLWTEAARSYTSHKTTNSTYADDQGYGGNALMQEGVQNAEGTRPHSQQEYHISRLTGQSHTHLWSEQPLKGCRERAGSNRGTPNTVTTPQKELDPYSKFTWTLSYV